MKVLHFNFSCSALLTSWSDSIARHRSSHAWVKSITPEQRTAYGDGHVVCPAGTDVGWSRSIDNVKTYSAKSKKVQAAKR